MSLIFTVTTRSNVENYHRILRKMLVKIPGHVPRDLNCTAFEIFRGALAEVINVFFDTSLPRPEAIWRVGIFFLPESIKRFTLSTEMMTRTYWKGISPIRVPLSFAVAERRFSIVKSISASAFIDALWESGRGVVGGSSHLSDEFDLPAYSNNVGSIWKIVVLPNFLVREYFISHIHLSESYRNGQLFQRRTGHYVILTRLAGKKFVLNSS